MSRLEKLEQMVQREPTDVFLSFCLAMELAKEGLTDRALTQFDRVLELDSAYIAAYRQKASVLLAAGRADDARAALSLGIATAQKGGDMHAVSQMEQLIKAIGKGDILLLPPDHGP